MFQTYVFIEHTYVFRHNHFISCLQMLLVFPHEDHQKSAFLLAAHRRSYNTKLCTTLDSAMEYFMQSHPEVGGLLTTIFLKKCEIIPKKIV